MQNGGGKWDVDNFWPEFSTKKWTPSWRSITRKKATRREHTPHLSLMQKKRNLLYRQCRLVLRQEAGMLLLKNRRGKPSGYAANERKKTRERNPLVQIPDGMPYSSCCEEFLHIPFRDESEDPPRKSQKK